jgi:ribosome-binding factor A
VHPRRLVRLNELIQQTVSRLTLTLKDPGVGFITITACETSPDVSLTKIFYSVLGEPSTRGETAAALERAKPYIRSELAKLENIRRVPHILFQYDDGIDRADRVNRILNTIHEEKKSNDSTDPD